MVKFEILLQPWKLPKLILFEFVINLFVLVFTAGAFILVRFYWNFELAVLHFLAVIREFLFRILFYPMLIFWFYARLHLYFW